MVYHVIYDGNCNLCVNSVKILESLDQGRQFDYAPMQAQATLQQFGITPQDCELGMILINGANPTQRWQGSAAVEEISRLLPGGEVLIQAYRGFPGLKDLGDRVYAQIRDHRYPLFGKRDTTYQSPYPVCETGHCGATDA